MNHLRPRAAFAALMALTAVLAVLPVLVAPAAAQAQGSTTIPRTHWTYVSSKHQNATHWQEDRVFVGFQERPRNITRAFFQMDLTSLADVERITEAWFGVRRTHSSECRRDVELWETGDIKPSTSWKRQPKWKRPLLVAPGWFCIESLPFRITAVVREAVAAGKDHITLGIRSVDETNPEINHELLNLADLSVTHNAPPDLPAETSVTSDLDSCHTSGTAGRYVNSVTPALGAKLSDPDRGTYRELVRGRFEWAAQDGTRLGELVSDLGDVDTRYCVTVPEGQLTAGSSYRWRVRAENPYTNEAGEPDHDVSEWTPWQEFTVDMTAPEKPPLVSSTDYPRETPGGHVYLPGAFTFTPNGVDDVAAYVYDFDGLFEETPAGTGGSATVTLKPSRETGNCLRVRSVDRAGNRGPESEYCFDVRGLEHPPGVSSGTYPESGGEPGGGVGIPGEFVFGSGDLRDVVTAFRYSYGEVQAEVAVDGSGSAKATLTPTEAGLNLVYVEALDRDGTVVWGYGYAFDVKAS
ncbi:hypothetical protein [Streptosporangium sp. NPDC002524]|uniref:hypothetical protein n=1 Tax=Streptosporangium sp. NPDC002524 TaxID=3154537 RepID=UPI003325ECAF